MTSAVATAGRGEQWNATVATFAELRVLSAPVGAPYTAGRVVTTRGGACHFTDSLGDRVWTAHLSSPAVRVVMLEGGGASGAGGLAEWFDALVARRGAAGAMEEREERAGACPGREMPSEPRVERCLSSCSSSLTDKADRT